MGVEPTISCLGSKRSATELHPQRGVYYTAAFENWSNNYQKHVKKNFATDFISVAKFSL